MSGNLGIGLGAFAEGLGNGINMGRQMMQAKRERNALDKQEAIDTENKTFDDNAKAEFAQGQAKGQFNGQSLADFMIRQKGPERAAMLIQQGDYEGAYKWKQWIDSDAAKQGTQLWGSAMSKAHGGDVSGAIDDAVKAAQVKGYIDHSLSLSKKEEIKGSDGAVTGYRLHMSNTKGDDMVWDVDTSNVEQGIAELMNPETAYQTHVDAAATAAKNAQDMQNYKAKKGIDASYDAASDQRKHGFKLDELKQAKDMGGTSAPPADVAAATWLAQHKAAAEKRTVTDQDMLDAYGQIRQAKDNPNGRAALVVRVYEGLNSDPRDTRPAEEKMAEAKANVDNLFKLQASDNASAGGAAPAAPGLGGDRGAPKGAGSIPVPDELKGEPNGTIIEDEKGSRYELRDGQLIPVKGK